MTFGIQARKNFNSKRNLYEEIFEMVNSVNGNTATASVKPPEKKQEIQKTTTSSTPAGSTPTASPPKFDSSSNDKSVEAKPTEATQGTATKISSRVTAGTPERNNPGNKIMPSIQSGLKSDTFSPDNPLFMGSLNAQDNGSSKALSGSNSVQTKAGNGIGLSPTLPSLSEGADTLPHDLPITKDTQNGTDKVKDSLKQIENDIDGKKLIKAAKTKGFTIEISDSTLLGATVPDDKKIELNTNNLSSGDYGENLTSAIAHELVHAATEGTSFEAETLATTLGHRIAKRTEGNRETPEAEAADYKKIYAAYAKVYKDDKAVAGRLDNGIFSQVQQLGIEVKAPWQVSRGGNAFSTLTTDGNYEKLATAKDGNNTLDLKEAQDWLEHLKKNPNGQRTPFVGSSYQPMIDALTYITTDGHYEQVAGTDGTISLKELQEAFNRPPVTRA